MTRPLKLTLLSLALLASSLAAEARYGTGLIGLKNLRAWAQKPEAVVSKTEGSASKP
jgi:hypothetical protein